jgi:hypothetical protein
MSNGGISGLPHVTEVHHMADGTVRVHVAVDDFKNGQQVEVSGTITQTTGTYATFRWTQKVNRPSDSDPNSPIDLEVPLGLTDLTEGQDVTVVTRVAEVWSTVLAQEDAGPGMKAKWKANYPSGAPGDSSGGSGSSEYPQNSATSTGQESPGKHQG